MTPTVPFIARRLARVITDAFRLGYTYPLGEPVVGMDPTVPQHVGRLFVGDGVTPGGNGLAFLSEVQAAAGQATSAVTTANAAQTAAQAAFPAASAGALAKLSVLDGLLSGATAITPASSNLSRSLASILNEQVPLSDFGPVGTADDTATWTKAINYANGRNGHVTILVPEVTTPFGALPPITVQHVYIVGKGSPFTCRVVALTAYGISWSTSTQAVNGGGARNVCIDSTSTDSSGCFFLLQYCQFFIFQDIYLGDGVMCVARMGFSATIGCNTVEFLRVRGVPASVPVPLFDLVQCNGFILRGLTGYSHGNAQGVVAQGRHVVQAQAYSCDTIIISECETVLYDCLLYVHAGGAGVGAVIQDIYVQNNVTDSLARGSVFIAESGSVISQVHYKSTWHTALTGANMTFQGAGLITGIKIIGCEISGSGTHGIYIPATNFKNAQIAFNSLQSLNTTQAAGTAAIYMAGGGGYQAVDVSHNIGNNDLTGIIANPTRTDYGLIVVAAMDQLVCVFNNLHGNTAPYSGLTLPHTNSIVSPNVGQ